MSATQKLLGGRYQFIQVLGTNSAGQTFLVADAHYPGHPRCVVRQLQLPTRNPMTLKFIFSLLRKKVEVLEVIGQHKQIPSTFAAFDAEQSFYIVQEFIPGRSFKNEMPLGKPWSPAAVLLLLKDVLPVIAFAQEHGVIHGNLKPSKLIRHQQDHHLVVLDFGSIKSVSQNIAGKEMTSLPDQNASETRVYLAPEQLRGQSLPCSDHYALGMMALQALNGLPASALPAPDTDKLHEVIMQLLEKTPDLSPNLMSLLARMVHPNPERRYQKAADILNDIDRIEESNPATFAAVGTELLSEEEPLEITAAPKKSWPWISLGVLGLSLLALFTGMMALKLPQRFLAAQHIQDAEQAVANNDLEGAIAQYNRAIDLYPNHAGALASRSQLHFDTANTEAALADITKAIEANPANSSYVYDRANIRFAIGDVQGAIEDYTTAVNQDPNFVKAYINRGSARAEWGDDNGALEDYTQAINLSPDSETQAAAYLNRCLSHSNLGDQTLALEDCTTAINLRPSHGLAYQNRGLVRRRLGDFQGSLQDYNIAIQVEPNSPDAYYNRGLTRQAMNDVSGAREDFSKAIAIAPDYVFAYYDRGLLEAQVGNRSQALADFRQASQLCLDLGRTGCYEDAQYQIKLLQNQLPAP